MRKLLVIGALIGAMLAMPLQAAIEFWEFDTPSQEARFKALSEELRCLVCQNQNIADSNDELAVDLRREIHEMITSGLSDREIIDFMVKRYGDFVLYRPPVNNATLALWYGPGVLFLLALFFLVYFVRNRQRGNSDSLSNEEQQRLHDLVDNNNEESKS